MKGIILAGGNGKRFSKKKYKLLELFNGKEVIKHVIDAIVPLISEIILVVGSHEKELKKALKNYRIKYIKQEKPLGTANAVLVTEKYLKNTKEDLLISCADKPLVKTETFEKIINKHLASKADVTLATTILENPFGKGRIIRKNGKFVYIIEEKDANEEQKKVKETNTGFLCVKSKNLFRELKKIDNNNAAKEYYLTDIFENYLKDKLKVETILIDEKEARDINTLQDLRLVKELVRKENPIVIRMNYVMLEA